MRIIFLDIDGVLNSELYYKSERYDKTETAMDNHLNDIDPKAIVQLNYITGATKAKVVISSTWRNKGLDFLREVLKMRGFTGEIIALTPYCSSDCVRGNEILKWIKENEKLLGKHYHDFCSYIILDDDSDMLYWQRENFLLIDGYVGLTPRNAYKAVHILERYCE